MKLRITFKDPDGVYESIRDEVNTVVAEMEDLDEDERDSLVEERVHETEQKLKTWIEYSEYITVEFDLDAGTATVVKKIPR